MKAGELLNIPHAGPIPAEVAIERSVWRRLWRHPEARVGLVVGLGLLLVAVAGPWLAPYDPNLPNYGAALQVQAPNIGSAPIKLDAICCRVLDGAHRSLGAAVLVLTGMFVIGLTVGVIAGMAGGAVDMLLMRVVDILMTLPGMVLAFAIIGILGPGFHTLLLALVIADWAYYARLSRSHVLNARQRPDVIAARLAGIGWRRILFAHVLPGVATQMAVVASLGLGGMISVISGFSFLGLGVQPPQAEWGAMLSEARFYFPIAPWLLLFPAGLIFLAVLAANLTGNALRDVLDPGERH